MVHVLGFLSLIHISRGNANVHMCSPYTYTVPPQLMDSLGEGHWRY